MKLHQMYRTLPSAEEPRSYAEEKQIFMYIASKIAGKNLIPFFENGIHSK